MPLAVGVRISGNMRVPGAETTFTENVSSRGARIRSVRRWQPEDHLHLMSLNGDFRSRARVAYCHVLPDTGFAIGIEFLEVEGQWVFAAPAAN